MPTDKYEREIGRIVAAERPFVGFHIAETGADRTSMATRRGPVIVAAEQWDVSALDSLERVDRHCREVGAIALYYDAGGSGASIRASLRQLWRERQLSQYPVTGVNFGASVEGSKMEFVRGQTNAEYFARRYSQLAWTLRLRATRTKRLMEGEDIDLSTCLVIDPGIEGLDGFLAQLSQPEFDETTTGKVEIEKSPDDAPNPDLFDAACLAMALDSRFGLRPAFGLQRQYPDLKSFRHCPAPALKAGRPAALVSRPSWLSQHLFPGQWQS